MRVNFTVQDSRLFQGAGVRQMTVAPKGQSRLKSRGRRPCSHPGLERPACDYKLGLDTVYDSALVLLRRDEPRLPTRTGTETQIVCPGAAEHRAGSRPADTQSNVTRVTDLLLLLIRY